MILPFKKQFVPKILSGEKIHTIREDKPGRWKPGRHIHAATGVRTKHYNCFYEANCINVQDIFMSYAHNDILEITIDDHYLYFEEKKRLANNDGFEDWTGFFNWFHPLIVNSPDKCYSGKIIHWTDFKY